MNRLRVALVGNPNCGKTTLFNALTGSRQQVGNWPGVTVERKSGNFRLDDTDVEVVDLPGLYSLVAMRDTSTDEQVAREYVAAGGADFIVNIVDAANLERNLYLSSQLLESGVPVLVALNMVDVAREQGVVVDAEALSRRLGCPVVPVVATRRRTIDALKQAIARQSAGNSSTGPVFAPVVEDAIDALSDAIGTSIAVQAGQASWLATRLLEGDTRAETLCAPLADVLATQRARVESAEGVEADILVADARYRFVSAACADSRSFSGQLSRHLSDRIDAVVLHRVLGIPIFLAVMYLMFLLTINVGSAFIDFFDQAFGAVLVDGLGGWLDGVGAPSWLKVLLANGVGGGVQTVATFIPVIGFLYLALSALEDSGYMARAAFVMDRAMRALGLPGKAFVPLIVGFGCNIPAIMATRTLEHRRDRILTTLMVPFMSCGARLPVYALFAAAFFPQNGQNVVFALYLIGIAVAVLTGLLMKHTLLKGKSGHFVMELPLYHVPMPGTVVRRAWDRLRDFVVRAGQVIVPMVVVLSLLNSMGTDGSFGHEDSEASVLAKVGHVITPAFAPMGIREENWQAAVGLFTGILAKEAVVGTLNALYAGTDEAAADPEGAEGAQDEGIVARLGAAFQTIPDNLSELGGKLLDPLGLDVGYVSDQASAAQELEASTGVFGAMQARFDGALGAFSYLLIILLYTPCVAANGAVRNELGGGWMAITAGWTFFVGYTAAVLCYQIGRFASQPLTSTITLAVVAAAWLGVIAGLVWAARHKPAWVPA
ncbi:Fe(2+) transporter permease subunit FeoB [Uliginosibacterium sp. H1]|uniref:Fe(2+) transporter permease subunit FeoB n=1 Tax=Uliginosibacterium sp. H1 TaxID=3114757 RepID=UPI002E1789EB|nr:Fe(2+) transporter permease subunit FeoB [Uliginosibacterium sp. H1]